MASKKELVGKPTGYRTNYGRTIYKTPKGERVSEKSVTFEMDGRWINIPSIHKGIRYKPREAMALYKEGEIKAFSIHKSREAAEKAAGKRSKEMKRELIKHHAKRSGGTVKKAYNNLTRKANYK